LGICARKRAKPPISTTEALGGHTSNLHAKTFEDEDDDEYEDDLGGPHLRLLPITPPEAIPANDPTP